MRTIERTGQFKRDYKREAKGQRRLVLDDALLAVLKLLIADKPVPAKYRDHSLSGPNSVNTTPGGIFVPMVSASPVRQVQLAGV